jgi:DNA polymerase V
MKDEIFALVDCNSFYCSCERVFRPSLIGKPVIVLSNNDGCAVARTDEVKALGIAMGEPFFKIKELCKKHNVAVFSSNYTLYGDMSRRVMETLSEFTPEMEIYSIDEAFLSLAGFHNKDLSAYGQEIRHRVHQYTGIPVSVGIAKTKVLAKLANKLAKKNKIKTGGVLYLDNEFTIHNALKDFPVRDVWGIGRQSERKLADNKIKTALELRNADEKLVQKLLTIQGRRIVRELKGEPCISLLQIEAEKKQIVSSRSFGRPVLDIDELRESIANHVSSAAEKLRKQKSLTKSIIVFVQTNPFKNVPQYYNSGYVNLLSGTSATEKMIKHAFNILDQIYKRGFEYKKCGVMLAELYPKINSQVDFFGYSDSFADDHRMNTIDEINLFHGRGTIKLAACGIEQFWQMLSQMKSPCYTTRWSELPKIG